MWTQNNIVYCEAKIVFVFVSIKNIITNTVMWDNNIQLNWHTT